MFKEIDTKMQSYKRFLSFDIQEWHFSLPKFQEDNVPCPLSGTSVSSRPTTSSLLCFCPTDTKHLLKRPLEYASSVKEC